MKYSVVIPSHNSAATIGPLMETLNRLLPEGIEILLVDDGSTDGSGETAARLGARVLRNPRPLGPAGARNRGVKEAQGDYIIFLDSDVLPLPDTISTLLAHLETGEIRCFTGVYDLVPTDPALFQRYRALLNHHYIRDLPPVSRTTLFVTAIAGIERSLFLELGGFDEGDGGAHAEDTEFGYRVSAVTPIWLLTDVKVGHRFPSFKSNLRNYYHRSSAWVGLYAKRGRFDDQTTTMGRGLLKSWGGVTAGLTAAGCLVPPLLLPAGVMHLGYMAGQARFLALLARHLEPWELPIVYFADVALAGAALSGAISGFLRQVARSSSVVK